MWKVRGQDTGETRVGKPGWIKDGLRFLEDYDA
jgi:hypothetical protein